MTITPQELQEVKDFLRVDTDFDDATIESLYIASIHKIEQYTSCVIKPREVVLDDDGEYNVFLRTASVIATIGDVQVCNELGYLRITIKNGGSCTVKYSLDKLNQVDYLLKTACKKYTYYLYENRDMYEADLPSDIQALINQCRRGLI